MSNPPIGRPRTAADKIIHDIMRIDLREIYGVDPRTGTGPRHTIPWDGGLVFGIAQTDEDVYVFYTTEDGYDITKGSETETWDLHDDDPAVTCKRIDEVSETLMDENPDAVYPIELLLRHLH